MVILMGKYDGKTIVVTEIKEIQKHGDVVKKEMQDISYEERNGQCYKKVRYIATYEDGTTSNDYESFNITIEEYEKATKL